MSTMQKIILWVSILIGVFILSDFLIYVGLNSNYKDIKREDNNSQIVVYQADATHVNGRIRGIIKNTNEIQGKYVKIELYSRRNVSLGKKYIEVEDKENNEKQSFELLFKAEDVASYKIEIVDEKEQGTELEIIPKEWTKPEVMFATALAFLIFWG